ncbi:MAG: undecaprenyl-diphosphate phosphatase [Zetaproteobacteria bacterium CG06_land_8_20_14_3_00_59_53]|nr:MAG: undecaprenyl-diphosphatase [Zetaproteobacteria bacterium CG2_30_59_37]PIO89014.1 MAG: undecaprenyl-diphosphate phosphatase [Zetaproteobacteria bacterium CG23_combo_of_CG06-09_8_20_14_all_59_86]PIQ64337.1 MAG: undecaprenyl-diphosphate phosphatase [Zetaproteobacteria bacterium CG11_big_fil_rev_8_21_14_0_20_59_439]PIU70317.1 MAG: undecaprenyl-diphosphate phosphatase [Zetaproteobacteria bacterium CG06_land_8_20_14_3_00_59_53]PIU97315.1 MAG: undecaprenyl-diphosphate phosphatase [Zetaproteoba
MDVLQAIILAVIEGVTEFLPISSTGHMIVASQWLGVAQTDDNKAFEVIIQLAAILAVVASYREKFSLQYLELWKKVVLAFIPIGAVGFLLHKQIKAMFTVEIVAVMFILGGIIFLLVEWLHKGRDYPVKQVEDLSYKQAAWIGFAQIFALIPGTSRAGASIIGALLVGLDRKASAEFSFLLAMPVMLAASGFDLLKHYHDFAGAQLLPLLVGFAVAFISAWLVMRLFISFLQRFTFNAFGIYRIAFGGLLLWMVM